MDELNEFIEKFNQKPLVIKINKVQTPVDRNINIIVTMSSGSITARLTGLDEQTLMARTARLLRIELEIELLTQLGIRHNIHSTV